MIQQQSQNPFTQTQSVLTGTVHWCHGDEFIWSRRNELFLSHLGNPKVNKRVKLPVPLLARFKWSSRLTQRLFRKEIKEIFEIGPRRLAINVLGSLYHLDLDEFTLVKASDFPGPAPLRMGFDGNRLIYGEYFVNPERKPVHVWTSTDLGFHWERVQTFTDIRHVHGIFHDPYDGKFWMTSGDYDRESHLRSSSDQFSTYDTLYSGKQLFRIIDLVFFQDHIIYGTDTPFERNYIVRMERNSRQLNRVQPVESSVFYLRQTKAGIFCTTAIEPSDVNPSKQCEVWRSTDGIAWKRIAALPKDSWSHHYFQFGRIQIPHGPGNGKGIWISPLATLNDGQSCFLKTNSD